MDRDKFLASLNETSRTGNWYKKLKDLTIDQKYEVEEFYFKDDTNKEVICKIKDPENDGKSIYIQMPERWSTKVTTEEHIKILNEEKRFLKYSGQDKEREKLSIFELTK
ncbi:uncharacterized protein LOC129610082 [Condylostylus longicornis]|uniref:uncharacterized protein LOC129610082 n=1 Tax=Condylostylus longicornis TaxID=2530218 RepID=UPI00244E2BE8|nr:uncharacterized protein LOC129610082 [Condylostylus longicornis]